MKKAIQYRMFDTDVCMRKLYASLVRDFRAFTWPEFKEDNLIALRKGMKDFRELRAPDRLQAPPDLFKMEAQLEHLFKRYRFKTDMYDDKQLSDKTFSKFMEGQLRLATVDQRPLRQSSFVILQRARKIIRDILEGFDPSQADFVGRFSTKATVGNPAIDAYLDHKLADPITGSPEHIKWFKSHLRQNGYLFDVIAKCTPLGVPCFEVCESLPLVGVPKSYKSERLISPNTLIGSYKTYGLGVLLVRALKAEGLDIARLQLIHQRLAKKSSKNRKLVTADLSAASESFLWSLINRLMPRCWVRAMNVGRLKYYHKDGKRYSYCSFMAMGIGFTFPLQTLLFYAMVKAICDSLGIEGTVSVYGDDLIYPRPAHPYVKSLLGDLGMVLNKDKTFVESNFRESCGGDYYHGVDVRPFSPEGGHQKLRKRRYEAWLYQLINGLCARWDPAVIPITYRFLCLEVLNCTWLVKQVPPSFPDYSGVRVETPDNSPFSWFLPVLIRQPYHGCGPFSTAKFEQFSRGSREYIIGHLTQTSRYRYVSFEEPYLYDWLRSMDSDDESEVAHRELLSEADTFESWLKYERFRKYLAQNIWFSNARDQFHLLKCPRQPKRYRSINGARIPKMLATTACVLEPLKTQTCVTDAISDWI